VTDWTTIATAAIAGAAGLSGAFLGYLGSRLQTKAETERFAKQLAEPHLQHRQAVYHDFLDSAHRFYQDAGGIEPFEDPGAYQRWAREHEHHLTAVSLFGTEPAWRAAQELAKVIEKIMASGETPTPPKLEFEFLGSWDETIKAMRLDTAPKEIPDARRGG
jgi:hypothetical protein